MAALAAADIGFGIYYPKGTHVQAPYVGYEANLPVTERITEEVLSIPVRPDLEMHELDAVISTVIGAVSG